MYNKLILGSLVIIIAILGFMALKSQKNGFNYAWINSAKVYSEFTLKKQLEQKMNATELARKGIIDSLELDLKLLYQNLNTTDEKSLMGFNTKREFYLSKKKQLEEDNEALEQNYNEQILNQLNQYLSDYAKEEGLEMLIGADGKGTIIYASGATEVTDKVIGYCNNKFEGKK